ncbi:hypothetical protein BDZ85DRAFT_263774 [Elsinoe ampelina]|uniref:Uncharacterized protein n=1 Tax=Elsinoe ampelina TaxID=302913 RepID=A0A6A6G9R3_9PEZI|nr:hypothetical protein BDZ85DRAFT_263774 [Elsinoe ampelina]
MVFNLLAAPPEIRMLIFKSIATLQRFEYSLYLAQSTIEPTKQVWRLRGPNQRNPDQRNPYIWSLTTACKTTYSEALTIFYGSVEIVITLPDKPCSVEPYAAALLRFPPGITSVLKSLIIDLPVDFDTVDALQKLLQNFDFGRYLSDFSIIFRDPSKERIEPYIPRYIDMLRSNGTIQPGRSEESARSLAQFYIKYDECTIRNEDFHALWSKIEFPFFLRQGLIEQGDLGTAKSHWTSMVGREDYQRFKTGKAKGRLKGRDLCAKGYSLP